MKLLIFPNILFYFIFFPQKEVKGKSNLKIGCTSDCEVVVNDQVVSKRNLEGSFFSLNQDFDSLEVRVRSGDTHKFPAFIVEDPNDQYNSNAINWTCVESSETDQNHWFPAHLVGMNDDCHVDPSKKLFHIVCQPEFKGSGQWVGPDIESTNFTSKTFHCRHQVSREVYNIGYFYYNRYGRDLTEYHVKLISISSLYFILILIIALFFFLKEIQDEKEQITSTTVSQ